MSTILYTCFRSTIDIHEFSTAVSRDCLIEFLYLGKIGLFQKLWIDIYEVICEWKTVMYVAIYFFFVQVWFVTSKAKLDIWYNKVCILVASPVAKQVKT